MTRFDYYLFKNLSIATVFITFVLTAVVFLTQSLKFLELVVESGASSLSFWMLTSLALPRFFEIIMPLAMFGSVLFVFNKMSMDSEMVAIRSIGYSPYQIGRSAVFLALLLTVLLYGISMYLSPMALNNMNKMRQIIQSQFSAVLFREGVFNQVGKGLTVYINDKTTDGEMAGVMIHDNRDKSKNASIILAKRGIMLNNDDKFQVVVYDGSRQEFNKDKSVMQRLNFDRYIIDLPESDPVRQRWREPEERTLSELFRPDGDNDRDEEAIRAFQVEINKRLTSPLLVIGFTLIAVASLLLGPVDRKGQGKRIIMAVLMVLFLQGGYITSYNMAKNSNAGFVFMYVLAFLPIFFAAFLLSGAGEKFRRSWFYSQESAGTK